MAAKPKKKNTPPSQAAQGAPAAPAGGPLIIDDGGPDFDIFAMPDIPEAITEMVDIDGNPIVDPLADIAPSDPGKFYAWMWRGLHTLGLAASERRLGAPLFVEVFSEINRVASRRRSVDSSGISVITEMLRGTTSSDTPADSTVDPACIPPEIIVVMLTFRILTDLNPMSERWLIGNIRSAYDRRREISSEVRAFDPQVADAGDDGFTA